MRARLFLWRSIGSGVESCPGCGAKSAWGIMCRELNRILEEVQQRVVLIAVYTRVERIPGRGSSKLIELRLTIPFRGLHDAVDRVLVIVNRPAIERGIDARQFDFERRVRQTTLRAHFT